MTIISPQLGISPIATTGGETYDRELLKQFVKLGQNVKVLLPKNKPVPPEIKLIGYDEAPLSHFTPPYTFNIFTIPWVLKKVHPFCRKDGPYETTVLRIHSPEYLFPTAYIVKKMRPKIPVVAHYHLDQEGKLWTTVNRLLLNMVDAVVADSDYLKRRLIDRVGVSPHKIHVIHCGVDTVSIYPSPRRKTKHTTHNPQLKTILFLGRFIERKRPDFALEIFARLHRKHPNTRLVVVGEGPMEAELKVKSQKLEVVDAIEFTGPLFGKEKLRRYHEADLFLFPSAKEGFVLVILEAMAAGLPLLVPQALGFPEAVFDSQNGYLAELDNIDDWVRKAEEILFNQKLNTAMCHKSRHLAETKFSWEQCAKANLEIYRLLCHRRSNLVK